MFNVIPYKSIIKFQFSDKSYDVRVSVYIFKDSFLCKF